MQKLTQDLKRAYDFQVYELALAIRRAELTRSADLENLKSALKRVAHKRALMAGGRV